MNALPAADEIKKTSQVTQVRSRLVNMPPIDSPYTTYTICALL